MKKYSVCELHHTNGTIKEHYDLLLPQTTNYQEYKHIAVFHSGQYAEIFGKKNKQASKSNRRLSIVKISYHNSEGKKVSIWREFNSIGVSGMRKNNIGLTYHSIVELGLTKTDLNNDVYVQVETGCWLPFYLFHSDYATRISTRLGLLSIIASFLFSLLFRIL